jgi:hypothetical protein
MAAERTYIQWNLLNWVTIVLMAFAGMIFIALVSSAVRHHRGLASTQRSDDA